MLDPRILQGQIDTPGDKTYLHDATMKQAVLEITQNSQHTREIQDAGSSHLVFCTSFKDAELGTGGLHFLNFQYPYKLLNPRIIANRALNAGENACPGLNSAYSFVWAYTCMCLCFVLVNGPVIIVKAK